MLDGSARRIEEQLSDADLVLDVGGWAHPFERADWVLDAQPYETRGLYGYDRAGAAPAERFSEETWVQRDVCDREPWPFEDDRFAFAVCSHTLEDLRDPVWVCQELARVARAGYVEVPSREEEQTVCLEHPDARWAGWSHHRWLCDVLDGAIRFVHKPHFLHVAPEYHLPPTVHERLTPEQRVQQLWWTGGFDARETLFADPADLREYLVEPVLAHGDPAKRGTRARRALRRVARR